MNTLKVFKLDGTLQCKTGDEISLQEMGKKLQSIGGEIIGQEKQVVPYEIPAICGLPTGSANVFTITTKSWKGIKRGVVGTLGFAIWPFDTPTLFVYKYDGTLQCGMGKEATLEEMAKELEDNKVVIHSMYKGTDGQAHLSLCGASTGYINVYEVDSNSFKLARELGFSYLMNRNTIAAMMGLGDTTGNTAVSESSVSDTPSLHLGEDPVFPLGDIPPFPLRVDPPFPLREEVLPWPW